MYVIGYFLSSIYLRPSSNKPVTCACSAHSLQFSLESGSVTWVFAKVDGAAVNVAVGENSVFVCNSSNQVFVRLGTSFNVEVLIVPITRSATTPIVVLSSELV